MKSRITLTLCCALCFVLLGGCGHTTYQSSTPPSFGTMVKLTDKLDECAAHGWELASPANVYMNDKDHFVHRPSDENKSAKMLLWVNNRKNPTEIRELLAPSK